LWHRQYLLTAIYTYLLSINKKYPPRTGFGNMGKSKRCEHEIQMVLKVQMMKAVSIRKTT